MYYILGGRHKSDKSPIKYLLGNDCQMDVSQMIFFKPGLDFTIKL